MRTFSDYSILNKRFRLPDIGFKGSRGGRVSMKPIFISMRPWTSLDNLIKPYNISRLLTFLCVWGKDKKAGKTRDILTEFLTKS